MLHGGLVAMATQALGADRAAAPQPHFAEGEWDLLRGHFPVQGARPWAPLRSARLSPPTPAPYLTGLRCYALARCGCSALRNQQGGATRALQSTSSTP